MRLNQLLFFTICFLTLLTATYALTSYWTPEGQTTEQPCPYYALPYCPDGKILTQIDTNGCPKPTCERNSNNCPPTPIPGCLYGSELQKEIDGYGCVRYSCKTPKACPAIAKICPDGTAVGQEGPNCEYAPCSKEGQTRPVSCGNGICEPGEKPFCPPCNDKNKPCVMACSRGNCPEDCEEKTNCGNGICEEGEADSPGGCGPNADPRCLGPPARQGSCPEDCSKNLCGNGICDPGEADFCPTCAIKGLCDCRGGSCPKDCALDKCGPIAIPMCIQGTVLEKTLDKKGCPRYSCNPETACTTIYEPVCGLIHVQCIKAPCYPVQQTFSNKCELEKNSLAEFLHTGPCEKDPTACSGCLTDDNCLPYGTRIVKDSKPTYCDVSKIFLPQRQKGESCQNSYECLSNQCSDGKCINLGEELQKTQGMLQKVLSWLGKIFG